MCKASWHPGKYSPPHVGRRLPVSPQNDPDSGIKVHFIKTQPWRIYLFNILVTKQRSSQHFWCIWWLPQAKPFVTLSCGLNELLVFEDRHCSLNKGWRQTVITYTWVSVRHFPGTWTKKVCRFEANWQYLLIMKLWAFKVEIRILENLYLPLLSWQYLKTDFLTLYKKMSQHLEDLSNLVNQCFPTFQCTSPQAGAGVKACKWEPLQGLLV